MKKILTTLLLVLSVSVMALAVPAYPGKYQFTQPDGSVITLQNHGDEYFSWTTDESGRVVEMGEDGFYRPVDQAVHQARVRKARQASISRRGSWSSYEDPFETNFGDRKILCILAEFSDITFTIDDPKTKFTAMLNQSGYSYDGAIGSVRDYYIDNSGGQYRPEFDVYGPVTLSKTSAEYYQKGSYNKVPEAIMEAYELLEAEIDIDQYDTDSDGDVDMVLFYFAGHNQAEGAGTNTIWPHQWSLSEATGSTLTLDGVKIDTYACSSELLGTSGSTIDGIGTMCHEYSHCLGLPDFYDTNYKAFGMSYWSVMDNGCNIYDGFCPVAFTAYERWFCGWLEPETLDSVCTVSALRNLEDYPEAYVIYNDNNANEYYLLANHQQVGWNSHAYGHGMMILHVDYNQKAWVDNTVNNVGSHQRMTIIPADNQLATGSNSLRGDLWPGAAGQDALTDETLPAATLFTANSDGTHLMHKPLYGIAEIDGIVSFRFMQEEPDGVQMVVASSSFDPSALYDLSGKRYTQRRARRGIYVSHGRKTLIR